jgi:hypothetical protein
MAVPADLEPQSSSTAKRRVISTVEHLAIRLYASGKTRKQVAEILKSHLSPGKTRGGAIKKLRMWEETQWFRDAVYDYTMQDMDMAIPQVMRGVAKRAKAGRTDAARLVLEVTGRHNPRGESAAPAVVQINLGGQLPRPLNRPGVEADPAIEGEVVAEEDGE